MAKMTPLLGDDAQARAQRVKIETENTAVDEVRRALRDAGFTESVTINVPDGSSGYDVVAPGFTVRHGAHGVMVMAENDPHVHHKQKKGKEVDHYLSRYADHLASLKKDDVPVFSVRREFAHGGGFLGYLWVKKET